MAKDSNQKLKIIHLINIFTRETDENHGISMEQIIKNLEKLDVKAERKSIYNDIEQLKSYGLDIIGEQAGRNFEYRLVNRQFELAELKLLVDAVQSSKFITAKKSNELIGKIEALASRYEAKELQRQVFVSKRIKTMNESIYYNVDKIHAAINTNCQIKFQYFQWNVDKEMSIKKDGAFYRISPWALSWDDENYYLIGYDETAEIIKHFRVDKMLRIEILEDRRLGKEHFERFDMAEYAKKVFGMFGGNEEKVTMEFRNELVGVVIDRFGKDIMIAKTDDQHFKITAPVAISTQFLAWVIGLGDGVQILWPDKVVNLMKDEIRRLTDMYM